MGTREDRQSKLLELIQSQSGAGIRQMAEYFGVSAVTIRSDLEYLEKEGAIIRTIGGAVPAAVRDPQISFLARSRLRNAEKRQIGQAAAGLINPGESVIVDAGTTAFELVKHLRRVDSLTIITPALNVALEACGLPRATVIVPGGGVLDPHALALSGSEVEESISRLHVDKYFMGVRAVHPEHGLTDTRVGVIRLKQVMMRVAREVIVVADSGKLGKVSLVKVAPVEAAHAIVTDSNADPAIVETLVGLGLKVHIARSIDSNGDAHDARGHAKGSVLAQTRASTDEGD